MDKRIGIWIRVSTDDQAKGESPEHHEQRARMYTQIKNWQVIEVYHLEAVSGKSVIDHPEAKRMIKDVKNGHITGLVFSKLARLARNTRELLDFADLFRDHKADLISLEENIDTSSPAGRLFYTLIAAMSQWEREEIASRVQSSIKVRAKLGKSLGGEAPYGYTWVNKELKINPDEAPIRKHMFELFLKHKRKRTVARHLNEQGYRTRRGGKWSDTSVDRLLKDPIAKGLRRVNYTTSTGTNKAWELKPEDEWEFQPVEPIVTEELWQQCNDIITSLTTNKKKVRNPPKHLFGGLVSCSCGGKMYMRSRSPKYVCKKCTNKIEPDILEDVFHEQLKAFVFSDTDIKAHLQQEQQKIDDISRLIDMLRSDIQKLKEKEQQLFDLYHNQQIPTNTFKSHHEPIRIELEQKGTTVAQLQAERDTLSVQSLSSDVIINDAQELQKMWGTFEHEHKLQIIQAITDSIVVGAQEIEINLSYLPTIQSPNAQAIPPHSSVSLSL